MGELVNACNAAEKVTEAGKKVRVVSMVCWELFDEQSEEYKADLLPASAKKISFEAGSTFGWSKYADVSIGIDTFGASAPAGQLYEAFGITEEKLVEAAL